MRRSLAYRRTLRFLASFGALCVVVGTAAPTAFAITGLTGQNVFAGGVTETVDDAANDAPGSVQTTTAEMTTAIVAPVETAGTTAPLPASPAAVSAASPGIPLLTAAETPASLTTTVNDVSATPLEAAIEPVGTTTPTVLGSADAIASSVAPDALAPVLDSTDAVGGTVSGVLAAGEDTVGLLPATGSVTTTAVAVRAEQQVTVRTETIGAGLAGPPTTSGAATTTVLRDRLPSITAPATAREQVRPERAATPALGGASDFAGMGQPRAGEGSQRASAKPAPAGERRVPERYAFGSVSPSAGSSGIFPILLAALAAGLFLVAPGLSRWLRLGLASWPRPILQLSLERPG